MGLFRIGGGEGSRKFQPEAKILRLFSIEFQVWNDQNGIIFFTLHSTDGKNGIAIFSLHSDGQSGFAIFTLHSDVQDGIAIFNIHSDGQSGIQFL